MGLPFGRIWCKYLAIEMNPQAKEFVPQSFLSRNTEETVLNGGEDTESLGKVAYILVSVAVLLNYVL